MVKSKTSNRVNFSNVSDSNGIDRISNLPDHLISHILSLLPTENAVATSVLSTRWKFLWTFITNLKLNFNCYHDKDRILKRKKFASFVDRVLLLLSPPSIQKFSLYVCCPKCVDPDSFNSWISAGFKLAVRQFSLLLHWDKLYELPLNQISCNVMVLELYGSGIHFNIPEATSLCFPSLKAIWLEYITCDIASNSSVSFPNLKIMRLTDVVMLENEDSIYKLLSSSPVLDDLIFTDENYNERECLTIHIPSLTRLSMEFSGFFSIDKVQIDCHALQYLNLHAKFPCEYVLAENLSCLVRANVEICYRKVDVDVESCNSFTNFVQNISNVKFLSVSDGVLKALKNASTNITLCFHNLTRLKIAFSNCDDLCVMINKFLERMDILEHLIIEGPGGLRSNCSHLSWWAESVNLPNCLLSRVITVSFSLLNVDCSEQHELLRYILKNAQVLQLLTVGFNCYTSKEERLEFVKKISLMLKGSRTCQVAFT